MTMMTYKWTKGVCVCVAVYVHITKRGARGQQCFVRIQRKLVSIEHSLIANRISNDDNKRIPKCFDRCEPNLQKYNSWGRTTCKIWRRIIFTTKFRTTGNVVVAAKHDSGFLKG